MQPAYLVKAIAKPAARPKRQDAALTPAEGAELRALSQQQQSEQRQADQRIHKKP
jgi:hypothetical protein